MVTLIAVYNSEGLVGRCDARCYNATSTECTCIYGGANHGAGLKQATENTREMCGKMIEEYVIEHNPKNWRAEVKAIEPVQLSLFEVDHE